MQLQSLKAKLSYSVGCGVGPEHGPEALNLILCVRDGKNLQLQVSVCSLGRGRDQQILFAECLTLDFY